MFKKLILSFALAVGLSNSYAYGHFPKNVRLNSFSHIFKPRFANVQRQKLNNLKEKFETTKDRFEVMNKQLKRVDFSLNVLRVAVNISLAGSLILLGESCYNLGYAQGYTQGKESKKK